MKSKEKNIIFKTGFFLNRWLPVIFWSGLIFYLSSIPNLKMSSHPFWDEIGRSLAHFLLYGVLYLLFFRGYFLEGGRNFWWPLLLSFLYAFSDELHQHFVPTRSFQIKDLLVDGSGIMASWLLVKKVDWLSGLMVRWSYEGKKAV